MDHPPPVRSLEPGQGFAIAGVAISAMAIFVLPLVLGPLAMVLGGVAWTRGERRGRWVIVAAAVAIALGLLLNLLPERFAAN